MFNGPFSGTTQVSQYQKGFYDQNMHIKQCSVVRQWINYLGIIVL